MIAHRKDIRALNLIESAPPRRVPDNAGVRVNVARRGFVYLEEGAGVLPGAERVVGRGEPPDPSSQWHHVVCAAAAADAHPPLPSEFERSVRVTEALMQGELGWASDGLAGVAPALQAGVGCGGAVDVAARERSGRVGPEGHEAAAATTARRRRDRARGTVPIRRLLYRPVHEVRAGVVPPGRAVVARHEHVPDAVDKHRAARVVALDGVQRGAPLWAQRDAAAREQQQQQ